MKKCGFSLLKEIVVPSSQVTARVLFLFAIIGKKTEYSDLMELIFKAFSKEHALYSVREIICQDSVKILCSGPPSLATFINSSLFGETFLSTSSMILCVGWMSAGCFSFPGLIITLQTPGELQSSFVTLDAAELCIWCCPHTASDPRTYPHLAGVNNSHS